MNMYCDDTHHDCQRCDYEGMCPREMEYIAIRNQDAREAAEAKLHELLS